MSKLYISNDLGCVYRLNNGELEYAPMISMDKDILIDDSEFGYVEPDLVGEEQVNFQGMHTSLYHVYDIVKRALSEDNK